MTTSTSPSRPRLEALEAVRGLAALVVVFHHLALAFWPEVVKSPTPLRSCLDGSFAVSVFFMLTGVVLSLAYFERPSQHLLAVAAVRRYFRLTPPILTSVLIGYTLLRVGAFANVALADALGRDPQQWMRHFFTFHPSIRDALAEGTYRVYFGHDSTRSYNSVLWTMSVEFHGSLFVLAFLALAGSLRRRGIAYFVVAMILHLQYPYMVNFLIGVALTDCYVQNRRAALPLTLGPGLGTILLATGLFVGSALPGWLGDWIGVNLLSRRLECQTMGAACLIAATLVCPFWRRRLEAFWLRGLGQISFSLYLIHQLVNCSVGCHLFLWLFSARGWPFQAAALVSATAVVFVSLAAAWMMTRSVDRWAIALGRKVASLVVASPAREEKKAGIAAAIHPIAPEVQAWRYLVLPARTDRVEDREAGKSLLPRHRGKPE
jgi:peptidoglycan/LPS O-acetylase OafA/YrhL